MLWDPTLVNTAYFANNYIFLVKVINPTSAGYATSQEVPPWGDSSSIFDADGNIDPAKLTPNIHYTLGAGDKASISLNGEYFKVIRKFNLAYNIRSLDTNMLPGNTLLHWKVNQPMGNFQIKQTAQTLGQMSITTGANVPNWIDISHKSISSERQYHLLYFSTNNSSLHTDHSPKLTLRVNYTYTSKEK